MLNESVLVLNRSWLAIHVCDVKRALTLLVLDLAHVVTEDYETYDFRTWCEVSQLAEERIEFLGLRINKVPCFSPDFPKRFFKLHPEIAQLAFARLHAFADVFGEDPEPPVQVPCQHLD